MANDVFANGREVSCKAADGKSICAFPDVCFTPPQSPATPPGVPVPYPNTGFARDTTSGSRSVKITGKEVMLKNKSYFKKSTGDEAGCAAKKGLITSVNRGKVYFTAWSMDVKFEGENVVRHMDLTTHNHASPTPNTGPWPYADSAAVGPGGACHDESKAIKESNKCGEPVEKDVSLDCCSVPQRKCVMVPYSQQKKWCCPGQQTGHHPVPVQEFHTQGKRGKNLLPGLKDCEYTEGAAPTVCVEGNYHREWEEKVPQALKEHGKVGNAYIAERLTRDIANNQYDVKYQDLSDAGAASVQTVFHQCDSKCIKHQLDVYHVTSAKIPLDTPVCRASQQPKQQEFKPPPKKRIKLKK